MEYSRSTNSCLPFHGHEQFSLDNASFLKPCKERERARATLQEAKDACLIPLDGDPATDRFQCSVNANI